MAFFKIILIINVSMEKIRDNFYLDVQITLE